mmetsp:Transcript_86107/g.200211  ORF Transcript_86107/g.200211 Transcript_86107/m.200211 type:complete len:236 (-) Transcript_86107:20-727(-)
MSHLCCAVGSGCRQRDVSRFLHLWFVECAPADVEPSNGGVKLQRHQQDVFHHLRHRQPVQPRRVSANYIARGVGGDADVAREVHEIQAAVALLGDQHIDASVIVVSVGDDSEFVGLDRCRQGVQRLPAREPLDLVGPDLRLERLRLGRLRLGRLRRWRLHLGRLRRGRLCRWLGLLHLGLLQLLPVRQGTYHLQRAELVVVVTGEGQGCGKQREQQHRPLHLAYCRRVFHAGHLP